MAIVEGRNRNWCLISCKFAILLSLPYKYKRRGVHIGCWRNMTRVVEMIVCLIVGRWEETESIGLTCWVCIHAGFSIVGSSITASGCSFCHASTGLFIFFSFSSVLLLHGSGVSLLQAVFLRLVALLAVVLCGVEKRFGLGNVMLIILLLPLFASLRATCLLLILVSFRPMHTMVFFGVFDVTVVLNLYLYLYYYIVYQF